mgnify:CR=1 FL=1
MPPAIREAIGEAYDSLCGEDGRVIDAAVRSSATCEDSAAASFAGQYESYLNVRGADEVIPWGLDPPDGDLPGWDERPVDLLGVGALTENKDYAVLI